MSSAGHSVHCEYGEHGVDALLEESDVVIVVDILSFSTCVDVAASRGAMVYPARSRNRAAERLADQVGGRLAGPRGSVGYSLSPASYLDVQAGARVVLPSPNGSTLSLAARAKPTLAGCLRNALAVAAAAQNLGSAIAVIAAGERWPDGSLRPCLEDWLGVGAIVQGLGGSLSPEARAAAATFRMCRAAIRTMIRDCVSGRELVAQGYEHDIDLACELNVSRCVPRFIDGAFVNVGTQHD